MVEPKGGMDASREQVPQRVDHVGDVNMEAAITSDDLMRAGGFGARDDLNSFLSVSSDCTDFESSLCDARDNEEPQGKPCKPGKNENGSQTEAALDVEDIPMQIAGSAKDIIQADMLEPKGGIDASREEVPQRVDHAGYVNMEAAITFDDVISAGGFGARDDLNSFLPVASDCTDFEASVLDARDYEEPQGEPRRPGLGSTEATESE
ncbi:hypothetical protein Ancab_031050 [Ancistrocladus abbreviatus]